MDILISNTSGKPIYEQITSQVKAQILSGELKAGDALPGIRTLAKELRISVITTKRAYEDLERTVLLSPYRGKAVLWQRKMSNCCTKKRCGRRKIFCSRLWTLPGGAV